MMPPDTLPRGDLGLRGDRRDSVARLRDSLGVGVEVEVALLRPGLRHETMKT